MLDAFSTPHNTIRTLILLLISGMLAVAATVIGIDDNPPGILLAYLAATAFVLGFVHPWRSTRQFKLLLLASLLGLVLFFILSIVSDTVVQNPSSSPALKNLIQSPASESLSLVFATLIPAALLIGAAGSVATLIRSRRQTG